MDAIRSILTMGQTAGPIHLVVWEVLYCIVLVLVLSVVLNRLLFRPVMGVLDERQRRLDAAAELQQRSLATLEERTREHSDRIAAARRDAFARLESARAEADALKREQLEDAKKMAAGSLGIARETITKTARKAEHELRASAAAMGRSIASRILGREVA